MTTQGYTRVNLVKHAIRTIAEASNWDFKEAGEGGGAAVNIGGGGTDGIRG
ncbi:hypothetical protein CRYPA_1890 [uncultured Candidatus Thioglobus sp.]|nr:hypothetical protein CRYPA_1890 [uncultured Candidatus Thioglobus sp.]